ncbi:TKL kinase, partial [Brachionus plicatilis]
MVEYIKDYLKYYENLKNEIDIHAEKLILSSQCELDTINLYRSKFLNKIQSITATILKNSKNQSNFNFNQEQIFCFFVPRTNFEIDLKIFHSNIFGFLIIANHFIDQIVIKFLKKDFNKEIGFKRQILLAGKDVIILNLFRNLIENRTNNSEGLIDLSDSNSNLLEKFVIKRNFIESFDKYDFEVVKKFINLNQLIHCDFEFNSLQEIQENLFSGLNGIKKFSLQLEEECSLKDKCFDGLNSLESIFLEGIFCTEISKEFFCGLTNLSHLEISYSNILNLGKTTFDELPNLNCLKFISNDFESISDSSIK